MPRSKRDIIYNTRKKVKVSYEAENQKSYRKKKKKSVGCVYVFFISVVYDALGDLGNLHYNVIII